MPPRVVEELGVNAETEVLHVSLDVTAVPARPAGAGRYIVELTRTLDRRPDVELSLITRKGDLSWGQRAPESRSSALGPRTRPIRLLWEQLRLPHVLARARPDVHHSPHYTMPERAKVPVVVTVHDCTFFDHPEWHQWSKVVVFRRAIRVAARRAAAVICVSEATEERLRATCKVEVPVVVAPHGVDHRRFRPTEEAPGADAALLGGFGRATGVDIERPMILYVGTLEPRKGLVGLVQAFDLVAERFPEVRLVLAGQPGWGTAELDAAQRAIRHSHAVVRAGYVPDEVLPALLRRALAVVYPALDEGFGVPALEAMACGTPLVTTSGTPMARLASGAALLAPPGDVSALGEAILCTLEQHGSGAARARRAKGIEIAAARTWEASAAAHVAAYRLAAASR